MSTTWSDAVKWAKAGIETARTALETAKPEEVSALQARITVLRELAVLTDAPKAPDLPPPVPYHSA